MSFAVKLKTAQEKYQSLLCVGLDPDPEKMHDSFGDVAEPLYEFCREVIRATNGLVCAYKPNLAFFEAGGSRGIAQLEKIMTEIPEDIPVILDAKRGDIGNSSRMYARFLFDSLGGDAATVSPYLGRDSLEPFLAHEGRCIFVLCVTSNPGAADLQFGPPGSEPLYHRVIAMCSELSKHRGEVGLVTGATHLKQLQEIRTMYPDGPLLVPGLGVQGGDVAATVQTATKNHTLPAVFNVSRGITYPGEATDFATAVRGKAMEFKNKINEAFVD